MSVPFLEPIYATYPDPLFFLTTISISYVHYDLLNLFLSNVKS